MKHIVKGTPPPQFTAWLAQETDDWKPSWDNLQTPEKGILHEALMRDQGCICCYCQQHISPNTSHIEHIVPRKGLSGNPTLALKFDNLLASCGRPGWYELSDGPRKLPSHCGNAKADWYDKDRFITPLNDQCERRFSYLADGEAIPVNSDKSAQKTIEVLKLNESSLKEKRNKAFEAVIQNVVELPKEELVPEIKRKIRIILARDETGMFPPFCQAVASMADHFLQGI